MEYEKFIEAALQEAREGFAEGGLPIGSILVKDDKIIGRGRNLRNQQGSVIFHAEMAAIEDAGIRDPDEYKEMTLITTLSPCPMCSGAVVFLGIPTVVIADNQTIMGAEEYLRDNGIKLIHRQNRECQDLMRKYQEHN